jgi:hypothetical protein
LSEPYTVHVAHIVEAVAEETGLPKTVLCRVSAAPRASRGRYLIFLVAQEVYGFPSGVIASRLRCSRTTVIRGCRAARAWLAQEPAYRELRQRVEARLCRRPSSTATRTA